MGNNVKPQTPREKVKKFLDEQLAKSKRNLELEKEADERISYAKTSLMKIEPFFGMLVFKLPTVPNYDIPSAATDGNFILYNPEWIATKILRKDTLFVLMHEIGHIFWKHNLRGPIKAQIAQNFFDRIHEQRMAGTLDQFDELEAKRIQHLIQEWNYATDYVINEHIDKHMPQVSISNGLRKEVLFNDKYLDWDSERVYEDIKSKFDPDSIDLQKMELGIGGILPQGFGQLTDEEVDAMVSEFEQEVQSAAMVAERAGNLPAGVQATIDSLYKTTTPWQDIFRTIFTSINKQDYTFRWPNKRYTQHQMEWGAIMPSLYGEEYVNVGFIMDTSGSVGEHEKRILVSELTNILEDYPVTLHVLYCDTKAYVEDVQILTQDDVKQGKLQLNVKGGGGTCMRPAFDYYRDNQEEQDFQVVICLTDMGLFDWGKLGPKPEFSVYWARLPNSDSVEPDWGTCIDIVIDKED